jgi:hypothetical protein
VNYSRQVIKININVKKIIVNSIEVKMTDKKYYTGIIYKRLSFNRALTQDEILDLYNRG